MLGEDAEQSEMSLSDLDTPLEPLLAKLVSKKCLCARLRSILGRMPNKCKG